MRVDKKFLKIFRDDLCKDQRDILVISSRKSRTGKKIRKFSTSNDENVDEIDVLNYLQEQGVTGIPRVLEKNDNADKPYIDLEYYDGIRVFNVLSYIRRVKREYLNLAPIAEKLRKELFNKTKERQKLIQKHLIDWALKNDKKRIYPQQKLYTLVDVLYGIIHSKDEDSVVEAGLAEINKDIDKVVEIFNEYADTPFRDATTKNMVLYYKHLYLGKFIKRGKSTLEADEDRYRYFVRMLKNGHYKKLLKAEIIDLDFSSCTDLTTRYDDSIGFLCHEINFRKILEPKELAWNMDEDKANGKAIAITFIVRYLRFGGRKLAYHMLHPDAYFSRFKYDHENFYFERLSKLVTYYWPESKKELPNLLKFFDDVDFTRKFDKDSVIDSVDEFEKEYPDCSRKFYIDIYPY